MTELWRVRSGDAALYTGTREACDRFAGGGEPGSVYVIERNCPFCRRRDNREYELVENWAVMHFEPLGPVVPGHRLFVPTVHAEDASEYPAVTAQTFGAAAYWARKRNVAFNLITSAGANATQTVRHLHVHYIPRYEGDGVTLPWTGQQRAGG